MSLEAEKKTELISKHGRADGDTGSVEVQVALLTERIGELTEHLRTHKAGATATTTSPAIRAWMTRTSRSKATVGMTPSTTT